MIGYPYFFKTTLPYFTNLSLFMWKIWSPLFGKISKIQTTLYKSKDGSGGWGWGGWFNSVYGCLLINFSMHSDFICIVLYQHLRCSCLWKYLTTVWRSSVFNSKTEGFKPFIQPLTIFKKIFFIFDVAGVLDTLLIILEIYVLLKYRLSSS